MMTGRMAPLAMAFAVAIAGGLSMTLDASAEPAELISGCYTSYDDGGDAYVIDQYSSCSTPFYEAGGATSRWDTKAFVGLSLPLGGAFEPHFNLGVRRTNVGPNGLVYGAEANVSVSLLRGLRDAQARLLGVAGGTIVQGNGGVGWDFGRQAPLLNVGLQVPYLRGSVDYHLDDNTARASIEANTLSAIPAVSASPDVLACGSGLVPATPTEALETFIAVVLDPPVSSTGDIFNGAFFQQSYEYPISGTQNDAAFLDGKTCFTVSN